MSDTNANLVLRTVYLSPDIDSKLKVQAFDQGKSKNDLIRLYIKLGMEAAAKIEAKPAKIEAKPMEIEAEVAQIDLAKIAIRKAQLVNKA